jgi:hypothetical protein
MNEEITDLILKLSKKHNKSFERSFADVLDQEHHLFKAYLQKQIDMKHILTFKGSYYYSAIGRVHNAYRLQSQGVVSEPLLLPEYK